MPKSEVKTQSCNLDGAACKKRLLGNEWNKQGHVVVAADACRPWQTGSSNLEIFRVYQPQAPCSAPDDLQCSKDASAQDARANLIPCCKLCVHLLRFARKAKDHEYPCHVVGGLLCRSASARNHFGILAVNCRSRLWCQQVAPYSQCIYKSTLLGCETVGYWMLRRKR